LADIKKIDKTERESTKKKIYEKKEKEKERCRRRRMKNMQIGSWSPIKKREKANIQDENREPAILTLYWSRNRRR